MRTGQRRRGAGVPRAFYFGWMLGSPPGLPGGGITGILLPLGGVGAFISGSTFGGQITPSVRASLSLSGSPALESGALPSVCRRSLGAQPFGSTIEGRSCADAVITAAQSNKAADAPDMIVLAFMRDDNRPRGEQVPSPATFSPPCRSGSARNAPSAASAGARSGGRRRARPSAP